jgi:hypothetical protein
MQNRTLQQDIVSNQDKLKLKLQEKRQELFNKRNPISEQTRKKITKEIDMEKKLNDQDPRVTQLMNNYFVQALKTFPTLTIHNPHTLLENREKETLKYYQFCIKLLNENNNNQDVLNNPYCNYIRCVLDLN